MVFFHRISAAACLMAAACTINVQAAVPSPDLSQAGAFQAAETGPGVETFSSGDTYAEYQWGLENDGSLQLVEIRRRFANGGSAYDAPANGPHAGLPIPSGPGDYEVLTTNAVPGVDINISPAW